MISTFKISPILILIEHGANIDEAMENFINDRVNKLENDKKIEYTNIEKLINNNANSQLLSKVLFISSMMNTNCPGGSIKNIYSDDDSDINSDIDF